MKTARDFTVGEEFQQTREVDRYRPIYYAAASGDFNPIHVDPAVGQLAGLQGAILQGMCTFSWLGEVCAAWLGDPGRVRRLRARFSRPVQVGDQLRFTGRCLGVERGLVRIELAAVNQRGEEVLKGALAEGVVPEA
jgi:acyl dehydratase